MSAVSRYMLGVVSYRYSIGGWSFGIYVGRYRVSLDLSDVPTVMG